MLFASKPVGGGEILEYWNQNSGNNNSALDTGLIRQFLLLPAVKIIIIVLILICALFVIMSILKIRNPLRGKVIVKELDHIANVKKHDESIIRANSFIGSITKIVEKSPFSLDIANKDYWNYNISRANIRIPGGSRLMRAEELNAIIKVISAAICLIGALIAILLNMMLGVLMIIFTVVLSATLPMILIRQKVKEKDLEITSNFADFYLMIHYVLLASANTPISGIMKSYDKTTNSQEMHRFIDTCIHYIDTYGEFEATNHIARQYREIPEVGKLMRLIKQANEGGDVRAELMGFRDELLEAKEYAIEKRMEKLIVKATASFNLLTPVLFQAILSAMAIYLEDLSIVSSFF